MDRDQVVEFVDRVKVRGLAYLVLLYLLNGATVGELSLIAHEDRHTIGDTLRALELRLFVLRVQIGRAEQWHISVAGLAALRLVGGIPTTIAPTTTAALISPPKTKAAAAEAAAVAGVIPTTKASAIDPKLEAALRSAGIGSNAWAGLAALPHVTVSYIKAHDRYRRERGESVGLLITRLRCGDPAPKNFAKSDPFAGDRARYMGRGVAKDWERVLKGKRGRK